MGSFKYFGLITYIEVRKAYTSQAIQANFPTLNYFSVN